MECGNLSYEKADEPSKRRPGVLLPLVRMFKTYPRGGRYHAKGERRHVNTYRFASFESRDDWLRQVAESHAAADEAKAKRAAEKRAPHTLQVGDLLVNSWGYDQTNVDYFQVVRRTDHMVWLRPVAQQSEETGFMSGKCRPRPGVFLDGKTTKHRVGADNSVKIHSWGSYAHKCSADTERGWSSYH